MNNETVITDDYELVWRFIRNNAPDEVKEAYKRLHREATEAQKDATVKAQELQSIEDILNKRVMSARHIESTFFTSLRVWGHLLAIEGNNRYWTEKCRQVENERDELADELTSLRVQVLSGLSEDQLRAVVSNAQVCSLWNEIQRLKGQLNEAGTSN
jgi:uncharacterized coiled-coil DUF342 family protein